MKIKYNTDKKKFLDTVDVLIDNYKVKLESHRMHIYLITICIFGFLLVLCAHILTWFRNDPNVGNFLVISLSIMLFYGTGLDSERRVSKKYVEKYTKLNKFEETIKKLDILYAARISPKDKTLNVELIKRELSVSSI